MYYLENSIKREKAFMSFLVSFEALRDDTNYGGFESTLYVSTKLGGTFKGIRVALTTVALNVFKCVHIAI